MFWGGERFFEGENYFLLPGSGEVGGRINSAHPNAKRWGHNELGSPPQDGGENASMTKPSRRLETVVCFLEAHSAEKYVL